MYKKKGTNSPSVRVL